MFIKVILQSEQRKVVRAMRPSGIGGQAVIEGVMMKNKDEYAIAIRKPDKEIEVATHAYQSATTKNRMFALPIVRGVVAFIESMVIGMKTITYSASFIEEEEQEHQKEKKKPMDPEKESKMESLLMAGTVVMSILFAIGIFILLPLWISSLLGTVIEHNAVLAILEGIIRITIFVTYILLISKLKDIQRVFMYHGAEHKTINCIENGYDLTVENVRIQSKEHKRCGTSFLLFVILISSVVFIFIQVDNIMVKSMLRLLLVPVIAGISYEFIRLAGKSESKVITVLSKPGLWMQGLTTKEPTDDMIEVAIRSVEAVFDWRVFLDETRADALHPEERINEADVAIAKAMEETAATNSYDDFQDEDEDDEILKAVDKYFTKNH